MRRAIKISSLFLAWLCLATPMAHAQDIWSAVKEGNLNEVSVFLSANPELLNMKNQDLLTPLNLAAEQDKPEIARFLLAKGADPKIGDRENSQPIHLAAISGSIAIAEMLLSKCVDVDSRDINLMTPLLFAASRGQLEMVKYLLDKGASAKAGNISGMGAMHYTAISGNLDLLTLLISKGGQVNARTDQGYTPLHLASSYGKTEAVKYLVEKGADVKAESMDGTQPLSWATGRNSFEAASFLVSKGADVNHKNMDGFTALHDAVRRGNIPVARLLIENGADINAATPTGFVPLDYTAWIENSVEMGKFLILNGADVNPNACLDHKACTCVPNFQTPLHLACQMGKPELADILVSNGARVNLFNADGLTPLHCAVKSGKVETVALLVENGAFVNVADKQQGCTELHFAAAMGYADIASFLAEKGSCPEMKDKCGTTPVDYAFYYGQNQVGYKLLAFGGDDSRLVEYLGAPCPFTAVEDRGEAMFWFLGHSGWAVKTSDHFLVFDYFDDTRARKADHACLAVGCIEPKELKNQKLTVFSSHAHQDHFSPSVFTWSQENPEAEYVLCFQPDGVSDAYTYVPVNTEAEIDGMKVYTIKSTDSGGGFLVEVDGLVIFHMGDHANGDDALAEEFTREIDLVAAKNKKIDVMLGPIRGCSLGKPAQVKTGTYYAIDKLNPAVFVPMHSGAYSYENRKFAEQAAKDGIDQKMIYPVNKGDHFLYVKGEPIVAL